MLLPSGGLPEIINFLQNRLKNMTSSVKHTSLFKGTAIVSGLTLFSRVLGFIRDLLTAKLFGAGSIADIFFVAFRIPNTLRSFVAEGAFTSAFIPVLAEEKEKGEEEAKTFISNSATLLLLTTLLLAALGYFFAPSVVSLFAPGFTHNPEKLSKTAHLLIIMLPYIPSISLVVLMNGVLTTLKHYGAGAVAQITVNCCLIIGILIAGTANKELQADYLAWSVFVAAFVQFFLVSFFCKKINYPVRYNLLSFSKPIITMLTLMVPALLGAAVYQLSILANTALASLLQEGSISWLIYADRISQLPIGVYTIALTSVLLPLLSENHAGNDKQGVEEKLISATTYTFLLLTPLSLFMWQFSLPITQVIFERGAFTLSDSVQTAKALSLFALGLLPFSLYSIFSRHMIAQQKPIIPATIGFFALCISLLIAIATMGDIDSANASSWLGKGVSWLRFHLPYTTNFGHVGLAFASVSTSLFSLLCYLYLVVCREKLNLSLIIPSVIQILISSVIMISVLFFANTTLTSLNLSIFTTLLAHALIGGSVYFLTLFVFKNREIMDLFGKASS